MDSMRGEWLGHIQSAQSFSDLRTKVKKIVNDFGFPYFIYRGRFAGRDDEAVAICVDGRPEGWRQFAKEIQIDERTDPLWSRALRQVTPILWREVSPHYPEIFYMARQFRLRTGITHPLHAPGGDWSAMSFVKDQEGPAAERHVDEAVWCGQTLICYVHEAVSRILSQQRCKPGAVIEGEPRTSFSLSSRQRECLAWASEGKKISEISEAMKVSERTVVYHLSNAQHKLHAANRTHAITRAISLGLIQLE